MHDTGGSIEFNRLNAQAMFIDSFQGIPATRPLPDKGNREKTMLHNWCKINLLINNSTYRFYKKVSNCF